MHHKIDQVRTDFGNLGQFFGDDNCSELGCARPTYFRLS